MNQVMQKRALLEQNNVKIIVGHVIRPELRTRGSDDHGLVIALDTSQGYLV